jgi:hypothetical protein
LNETLPRCDVPSHTAIAAVDKKRTLSRAPHRILNTRGGIAVHQRAHFSHPPCLAVGLLLTLLGPALSVAAELQPETLLAWNRYVEQAKGRMNARLEGRNRFLWIDEKPDRARRVRKGEILVAPVNGTGRTEVTNGLIHDWIGAAFFPETTIEKVFDTTDEYACYKDYYRPLVIDSKLLSREGSESSFNMRWLKKALFVTAVMDADYKSSYFVRNEKSRYGYVWSTRIQDVVNYGQPSESKLPAGTGNGFIWRLFSMSRFEERDGGVYVELEAMALSRPVPSCLAWLVNPVVNRLSQSSMVNSLSQTREAVRGLPQRSPLDVCRPGDLRAQAPGRSGRQ